MRINTNLGALTAATNLTKVNDAVRASSEKLSSGFRINKAGDDAAGLGVANTFRADIRSLTQAQRNAEQASAVYAIAEGGVSSIEKILERMKELAVQAASDSVDSGGRTAIQAEFTALRNEITRVTETTEFQGQQLLKGAFGNTTAVGGAQAANVRSFTVPGQPGVYTFAATAANTVTATFTPTVGNVVTEKAAWGQTTSFTKLGISLTWVGAVADNSTIGTVTLTTTASANGGAFLIGAAHSGSGYASGGYNVLDVNAMSLGVGTISGGSALGSDISTNIAAAQTTLGTIDTAITTVNGMLGNIGAGQNRLSNAIDNLKSTILNYQSAESTIRDLDMAAEMVSYSKNQILAQAGTAMLAQANQSSQGILKLLQ